MFVEEEWTDGVSADDQTQTTQTQTQTSDQSVGEAERVVVKHKTISRLCLKRTLQTLGSAPDWEFIKPAVGSEKDPEDAPIHHVKKKKKQKCKKLKLKKSSGTGVTIDNDKETDKLQKSVKKQQVKFKVDPVNNKKSLKTLHKAVEDSTDKKLSRQQWKNKIKNKRRCKNKFLSSAGVAVFKLEETVCQTQKPSLAKQNDDPSLLRTVTVEKKYNVPMSTDMSETTSAISTKVNKDTQQLTPEKPIHNEMKTSAHDQCEKQKPYKVDKKSLLRAKKLQRFLNIHATERNENPNVTNVEQEKDDLKKNDKCQMDRSSALRSRMEKRLESARFRYINELLYTSTSGEAKLIFMQDPDAIRIYHSGYTEQVKLWPANPVDSIISYIRQRSSSLVIADFGCGDCKIAQSVENKVHCFDLAPICHLATACDMASVPLGDSTVDIAVFCLSLMGTNLADFLAEANRVLVMGGVLKIAEVASRFDNVRQFTGVLSRLGFKLVSKDTDNSHFYSFEFLKAQDVTNDVKKIELQLKPCLYKKR